MNRTALTPTAGTARLAVALTAAGALAGGVWVAEARPPHPQLRVIGLPEPGHPRHATVSPTSLAITGTTTTSLTSYSRTSSATPSV